MAAGDGILCCGMVFAKTGGKVFKKRLLVVTCGGKEDQPAKLELFKCNEDALTKTKMFELSFCKVERVQHQLTEDMKNEDMNYLDTELKKWSNYCVTLQRIPTYSIPQLPPKVKPVKLGKCSDTVTKRLNSSSAWEVFIVNTGVGCVLSCAGKQIISLHDKDEMFLSINNFHTKKSLHTWSKSELRLAFGCVDSMVYVEIPRHGLLWMYCSPETMAMELNETIYRHISHDKSTSSPSSVETLTRSYDSGIGSSSSSYHTSGMLEVTRHTRTGCRSKIDFTSSQFDDQDMPLDNSPLESYVDGLQKFDDLNHTPDLDSHLGNTTTAAGHKNETFITSSYKGVSTRQHKRNKNFSPYLATKKQQVFSQSLPPNLEECRVDHELDSHCEQQRNILWDCFPDIVQCLNVTEVLPYLMSEHLITETDLDILRNKTSTRVDKIHHLIEVLPRIPNSLKKFINCLHRSSNGTAHNEIARRLKQLIDSSHFA